MFEIPRRAVFWAALAALVLAPVLTRASEPALDAEIAAMSIEDKVGQLMMVSFGGTEVTPRMQRWVRERRVGGVVLFSRNLREVGQIARLTRDLQMLTRGGPPLFLALDQEGGTVSRVKEGAVALPGNMALGAARDPQLAYAAGQSLAVDLRALGFNMNLAPVLDVNSNPANPVIGVRSYGEHPALVAEMGTWFMRGMMHMGVLPVAKHFPGHGDTTGDSHHALPRVNADVQRLWDLELVPFRAGIWAGLPAVMTAHIALPNVAEAPDLPATLSRNVLTDLLRTRLGFDGIVITDGLEMQGISARYGGGRAAVQSILAGADMPMVLWTSRMQEAVYSEMLRAVRDGVISEARLNASVRRVLRVKRRLRGASESEVPLVEVLDRRNVNPVHARVSERIAQESLTLVRNEGGLLPLKTTTRVVAILPPGSLRRAFQARANTTVVPVSDAPGKAARMAAFRAALAAIQSDSDVLLGAASNGYHVRIIRAVAARRPRVGLALVSLGSPYFLGEIPDAAAYVCAYSALDVTQRSLAEALVGRAPMPGRLPVSLPGLYPYGHAMGTSDLPPKEDSAFGSTSRPPDRYGPVLSNSPRRFTKSTHRLE